ncbi:4-alpha-glucanotransferase [Fusobacterium sp.]|uniref:4-alpha-glucanotransferase n=1 Tax=Fusobacterium sp. TaxID=68766 RepID=UPI00396C9A86
MGKRVNRGSGILMHISSLPGDQGIGTFGKEAYRFIDFLKKSGQKYWQILPLGQTSYGDSPYQSFSIDAGNPYFIDLDMLHEEGLLEKEEYESICWGESQEYVDYEFMYHIRYGILGKAFEKFKGDCEYEKFIKETENWLDDYALFMSIKKDHKDVSWDNWEDGYRKRDRETLENFKKNHLKEIEYWKFIQFKFYEQWKKLKKYAGESGVEIIGDIPIYVAYDSVDVWKNPEYFQLDVDLKMVSVAGCPPDAFSPTGQLWGNPLYNWEYMKSTGYRWWIERLQSAVKLYDVVRVDHFRGFAGYYSISAHETTAVNGKWKKGPGIELFKKVKEELGDINLIAEDLGFLTEDVIEMLKESGYPGMKLLQFAFDSREGGDYLPHNYTRNSVVYIGTHDNDTALGWIESAKEEDIEYMKEYLDINSEDKKEIVWKLISRTMATVSDTVIIQMQDYLQLDNRARMNIPSTLGGNWCWRMKKGVLSDELAEKIYKMTDLFKRV